jgi:hypothetical protein
MEPEGDELIAAISAATERFVGVARQVRAPATRLRDSNWSAADLVAHVAAGADGYARYLEGDVTPFADITNLAGGSLTASNAGLLAEDTERDIGVLVDRLSMRARDLCTEAAPRSLDEPASFHGRPAPLRCILASTLAEILLHGRDLATSIGVRWPISKREATLVLENIAPLFPLLIDPDTTRVLVGSIRVRLRGGRDIPLRFDRGTLTLDAEIRRFDATVSADPVAFLLVAYGRRSQWSQIVRGGLVAWGRRPWLALRLKSYLVNP